MGEVTKLYKNGYLWIGAALVLIATLIHYLSTSFITGVHLWMLLLGVISTVYCAIHLGFYVGILVGFLTGFMLIADIVLFSKHSGSGELATELAALGSYVVIGAAVGIWADRRNKDRPHPKRISDYWASVAETTMGWYITKIEKDFVSHCLTSLPEKPKTVLDVGAGFGKLEPLLANSASRVLCTEIDTSLTKKLARLGDNISPLLVSKASNCLPLADASIDYVICLEVPSLAEQDWFYAECHRVLKPQGAIVLSVTNRHSWKGTFASFWLKRYMWGDSRYYQHTLHDIRLCLKKHGFTVRRAVGLNWIPFLRASDSPLIGVFVALEKIMQLRRLVPWSPWVLLEGRKIDENRGSPSACMSNR